MTNAVFGRRFLDWRGANQHVPCLRTSEYQVNEEWVKTIKTA